MESESGEDFLISRGAPFFELQRQIGLLTRRRLNSGLRATIYITLTAGVPLVLGFLSGGVEDVRRMLLGPEFMARFVLFIAICFMMERSVDVRLRGFLRRFEDSGLLGETELARGATAVTRAIRLRNSWAAEFTCVALAIGFSVLAIWVQPVDEKIARLLTMHDGEQSLTAVGWWIFAVSNPLFGFLVFRWLWRYIVWSILLFWISRLDLRLVSTHPDGVGGLGFIAASANTFAPLVFGISSVLAAGVFNLLHNETLDVSAYSKLMTIWLGIVLLVFMLPQLSFRGPLGRLKALTLRETDMLATRIQRAAERKLFERNLVAGSEQEPSAEDAPDPTAFRKAASSLRTIPFSRGAVVPLALAAVVPMLIAGGTQLPFSELLHAAKALVFL